LSSLLLINSLTRTYKIKKFSDSEISKLKIKVQGEIIYSDGLYYLLRHRRGIEITKTSKYNINDIKYDLSSIYRYKQYIFIIKRFPKVKLLVIDTEKDMIVIFAVYRDNLHSLTKYRISYYFYPIEKHKKLIFIHRSLDTIIVINTIKLQQVLNKIKADRDSKKDKESYEYDIVDIDYICEVYYTPQLILNAIQSDLNIYIKEADLHIIGHYFDNQNHSLYLVVKLAKQDIQTTALFVWNCVSDEIRFKPVCHYTSNKNNVFIKVSSCGFKKVRKHLLPISNMELYGVTPSSDGLGKFDSLYLSANRLPIHLYTSHFVDTVYNRFSYKLYQGKLNLRISRIGKLILMEHKSSSFSRENDDDIDIQISFCFILSQLQLVMGMSHVVV